MMNQSGENDVRATAEAWFSALQRGDGASALALLDEHVVWSNTIPEPGLSDIVPWLGRYDGRDAVAGTFAIWAELSKVESFAVRGLFLAGDEALAIVHERALVKSTGLHYDIEFVQRLKVANGHIVAWTSYWDTSKGIVAFRGDLKQRLIAAVHEGDLKTAEIVLQAGLNPDSVDGHSSLTALMLASGYGHEPMVELLLNYGANPNAVEAVGGTTALHKACQRGSLPVVRRLVESGARLDLQTATTGHSPLMEGVWYKWPEIVSYLLDQNASINLVTHYGFTLDDHIKYAKGVNPLQQELIRKIEILVAARRERDQRDAAAQGLLTAALNGNLEICRRLLEGGADVDARYPILNGFEDDHTPLLVAARQGHAAIVSLLLEHGADVNAVESTFGAVPLHKATYNGHADVTRILAAHPGVNLDFQGASNGYTPLHDALWHGFDTCAKILVEAGARLDIVAYDGKLPVDIAREVFGEDHAIVGRVRPPLGARPFNGLTPWNRRLRNGVTAIVEQLQASGLIGTEESVVVGNPGSGEEWFYLELDTRVRMALAEAAVGSILDGAGRVRNKAAVAICHGYVGFSGLQGSVFNAAQRQSPMLVIVSIADSQAHTGETHMYADVEAAARATRAKYVMNATDPATLLRDLRHAIIEAGTPPFGPVVFIVGFDVGSAPNHEPVFPPILPNTRMAPPMEEIERLAGQLLATDRTTILIGDGVSRSGCVGELVRVAELLGSEVWGSMESEVNFPRNHPLYRGNLGHMEDSEGRRLLADAETVMAVGTPVYQTVFNSKLPLLKPGVPLAVINPDLPTTLRGHNDVTLPVLGDPRTVFELLAGVLQRRQTQAQHEGAVSRRLQWEREKQRQQERKRAEQLGKPGITMAKFAHLLEKGMKKLTARPVIFNEALVGGEGLTDHIGNVDLPGYYFDTSGGSLGEWAGSIGAAMTGRSTLAVIGDGGFNYAPQALWNAARAKLPLGMVVGTNRSYGLLISNMEEKLNQRGIDPATISDPHFYHLPHVDHVRIAEGYGVPGMRVEREDQMEPAVDRLLDFSQGPFLVDLILTS